MRVASTTSIDLQELLAFCFFPELGCAAVCVMKKSYSIRSFAAWRGKKREAGT